MNLPNGPWKDVFKGDWSGYEIEVKENPDKMILTLIYEKEKSGVVTLLNRFYAAQGNVSKLLKDFKNYSIILEKQFPTHNSLFFSLSTGPRYTSLEMLNESVEDAFKKIEFDHEKLNERTKVYAVNLTELRYAEKKTQKDLFSDPLLLPGLLMKKTAELQTVTADVKVSLGNKITGGKAEEEMQSFLNTMIIGNETQLKRAVHVILENAVLSGKTGIVFDYDDSYSKMNYPNKEFDYDEYKDTQPIGMPIKHLKPEELKIDLNVFNENTLLEVFGLDKAEIAKETTNLITQIFNKNKGSIQSLEDLEEKLMTITIEAKKFHVYRAIRWIRIIGKQYPEYFSGKLNLSSLIPSYVRTMGSVVRVDAKDKPTIIKKAIFYSLIKSLLKEFQEQAASNQIKVIACLLDANKFIPANPKKEIDVKITETVSKALEYGIGFCGGTESEVDLFSELSEKASIKVNFVGK